MKAVFKKFAIAAVMTIIIWIIPEKSSAQVSLGFQVFYDDLSPYGTWVNNSQYGYVWYPSVSAGFTPYGSNGYWIMTDYGWTWVSNYPWGWAPFHYGRWYTDPMYGSMWIPGDEWGPGWVTWRSSGDYYGWAPIGPGISLSVAYSNAYNVPYNQWIFVRNNNFGNTNITNYYINNVNNVTIIGKSKVINTIKVDKEHNISFNGGPERREVEKYTGKIYTPANIRESTKPVQVLNKGELQIYRPQIHKNNLGGKKEAPSKVANVKELKTQGQRKESNPATQENKATNQAPTKQRNANQPATQNLSQPKKENKQAPKQEQQQQRNMEQPARREQTQQKQGYHQPTQRSNPTRQEPGRQEQQNKQNEQPRNQPLQRLQTPHQQENSKRPH